MRKYLLGNPYYLLIIASIVLSVCAQLLMKLGMLDLHNLKNTDLAYLWPTLIWVFSGLACYAFSMFLWMLALTKYELSFAYPLLSMSYVLVYISAAMIPQLNESMTIGKTAGIVLIFIGVVLVTRTKTT